MQDVPNSKPITVALVATIGAFGALFAVDVTHNAIAWHWDGFWPVTALALAVYVLAVSALAWASKVAASQRQAAVVAVLALLLAISGLGGVGEEHGSEVKPRHPSPVAFRVTRAALTCLPLLIVSSNLMRRRRGARAL